MNARQLFCEFLFFSCLGTSAQWLEDEKVSVLVSVHHTQVPLLQGDAVDHDELVQVLLGGRCTHRDPSSLRDKGETEAKV